MESLRGARRTTELDSEIDRKRETYVMAENTSSETPTAGDKISEIISSGMCGTTMFSEWRQKGGDLSGEQLQLRKSESNRSPAAHLKLEVYEP
jgi:hypothetical protein